MMLMGGGIFAKSDIKQKKNNYNIMKQKQIFVGLAKLMCWRRRIVFLCEHFFLDPFIKRLS